MKLGENERCASKLNQWLSILALGVFIVGCSGEKGSDVRFQAEKALFEARKLKVELANKLVIAGTEFLDKTLGAYRDIVSSYESQMKEIEGLEEIVVSAQIDIAELCYQAAMLPQARKEFLKAFELADNISEARVTALYSAAYLSEEIEDYQQALSLFERFDSLYLDPLSAKQTIKLNSQYLATPLKIAELYGHAGDEGSKEKWLENAEKLYKDLIARGEDADILKVVRYNLLATYLQGRRWEEGLNLVRELMSMYADEEDRRSLQFLEAKIWADGLDAPAKALDLFKKVQKEHPVSPEAPSALLSAAYLAKRIGRTGEAKELYKSVIKNYRSIVTAAAEANWQLALIDEEQGNWLEASLRYNSIAKEYPGTIQSFEAPLRIAKKYSEKGEHDAAKAAYQRAIELYKQILSPQYPPTIKILAEEYIVRALIELEQWKEAVDLLMALPDRYPGYTRFQINFLTAASILEEKIKDEAGALQALEICIARYPGSDAAFEASRQLERMRSSK
ncbi:MAG: tetratricopeptide repeat protein [Candidatus Latescibacteria bacterium]|nr:tetratricopeptide repeat protein [Candidatus Latescibacterota bacterium]NIO00949.1 tetratricopeptide repeat protein [Candidatus Latescibacterota bacterium]NIO27348.1 tetratricopeptide repeat protein [Candidatus Latescibacterota bacterium]NIO54870.1 tetratricopeptide repeat protein [Candidatus Latescibacterota bacterium]NIT00959.1 tetratricopeptide repeat protein [Candidatus Latescibacterota bacterium]